MSNEEIFLTLLAVSTVVIAAARLTYEPKISVLKKMPDEYEPLQLFLSVNNEDHDLLNFLPLACLGTGTFLETVVLLFNGLFRIYWLRKI